MIVAGVFDKGKTEEDGLDGAFGGGLAAKEALRRSEQVYFPTS